MADKNQQAYPMEQTAGPPKNDVESTAVPQSDELRRKKRIKYVAYFAAFAVFQTIVILVFALTVMRIKSPKFRLRSVAIENLSYSSSTASPSFNIRFNAKVGVKNTNFGHYKFQNSTITLAYKGIPVGEASIAKARARARSTKKMNVTVVVTSKNVLSNSNLVGDLNSGVLTLTSQGKLTGKVHLMKVMKKNKSAQMNCTININLAEKAIQDFECR